MRSFEDKFKNLVVRLLELFFKPSRIPSFTPEAIRSILVIRQHDQLGDMLCVVPLLRSLRSLFPSAHITMIASPVNYEIMKHHPYLHDSINYDKQSILYSLSNAIQFFKTLRGLKPDLAIVPATVSVSVTSDMLALISGAKIRIGAKNLSGKPNPTAFCFTHAAILDWGNEPHRHQSLRNLDSIRCLKPPAPDLQITIGITESERLSAENFLKPYRSQNKILIGFHPGAGKKENQWSAERFAYIANRTYAEFQAGIIITSGPKDGQQVAEMVQYLKSPYLLIENQPIRNVAAMINQLDMFISNDTGIMHVAGGTKTPLLALFGPTDYLQWMPQGKKNRCIVSNDGNMDSIDREEVYAALCEIIRGKN